MYLQSQDKLDLTEKLTAEKFLNRELTIKLAEIEEKSKDMHTKLMAKDDEMIRLLMTYRDLEKHFNEISAHSSKKYEETSQSEFTEENIDNCNALVEVTNETDACLHEIHGEMLLKTRGNENLSIPQEDAMLKLQERFMKIMGEVADLSDEKHRLEHIILQLQNETDTICEYVALYQQQRSLLKKRDEERNAQIKLFQVECDRLKNQLEELSGILLRFAEDKDLASYFQVESRQKDMDKVRSLLINLKSNTLVDPKNNLELSNIYPCNCCSGNLIDV